MGKRRKHRGKRPSHHQDQPKRDTGQDPLPAECRAVAGAGPTDPQAEVATPLQDAIAAARDGNPVQMVELLLTNHALAGVLRYQVKRWPAIPADELEHHLAGAVSELYWFLEGGGRVHNPLAWLIKVTDRMAMRFYRERQAERPAEETALDKLPAMQEEEDLGAEEGGRAHVLRLARGFLPRLGHDTAQRVMAYLFDAVEAGVVEISRVEMAKDLGLNPATVRTAISRGFQRLRRIAAEEGFDLAPLAEAEPEAGAEDEAEISEENERIEGVEQP